MAKHPLLHAYQAAIESVMQGATKEKGREAARVPPWRYDSIGGKRGYDSIGGSDESHVGAKPPALNLSQPSSSSGSNPNRSRDQQLHDAVMAPSGDSDGKGAPDQRTDNPTSMGHFLTKWIAFAIYKFLEGEKTQLTQGVFAKKRRQSMMKHFQSLLDKDPQIGEDEIVLAITEHLISQRTSWKLHFSQEGKSKATQGTGELHPICKTNEEGASMSRDLLAHMYIEAPNIVEEARSEAKEAKKQND